MGRQRGLVHLSGQYDDVQLTIDGNRGIAKMSPPLEKDRILNDKEFALTRKNMSEFGGASKAVDTLMRCLGDGANEYGDRYWRSRMQKQLTKMLKKGPGEKGQRKLELLPNRAMLNLYDMNPEERLANRVNAGYTVAVNGDRNTVYVDFAAFPPSLIKAPEGATHFVLRLSAGVVSDYEWAGDEEGHAPTDPLLNGLAGLNLSLPQSLGQPQLGPIQLIVEIPGLPVLPPSAVLVVGLGIDFYLATNQYMDRMAQGNALCVLGLY